MSAAKKPKRIQPRVIEKMGLEGRTGLCNTLEQVDKEIGNDDNCYTGT
jgi:hypothetical protein